jgi:hypothetical protein
MQAIAMLPSNLSSNYRTYALTRKKEKCCKRYDIDVAYHLKLVLREQSKPSTAKCNRSLYILFLTTLSFCQYVSPI